MNDMQIFFCRPDQDAITYARLSLDPVTKFAKLDIIECNSTSIDESLDHAEKELKQSIEKISLIIPANISVVNDTMGEDLELIAQISSASHPDEFSSFYAPKPKLLELVRGFNALGIQVSEFLDERACYAKGLADLFDQDRPSILLDIERRKSQLHIFQRGVCRKSTSIPLGYEHFINDLNVGLGLSKEEATELCFTNGLLIPADHLPNPAQDLSGILGSRARDFATHLAKTLIHYKGQLQNGMLLCGKGAAIPGLAKSLAQVLKIDVRNVSTAFNTGAHELSVSIHANELIGRDPHAILHQCVAASLAKLPDLRAKLSSLKTPWQRVRQEVRLWIKDLM